MVKREFYMTREDGVNLYRTYSDEGYSLIRNDGVEYMEAIDVENAEYTYTESENLVEIEEVNEESINEIIEEVDETHEIEEAE